MICCRVQKELEEKKSILGNEPEEDLISQINEYDFVPHYQRVAVSGEDTSGVSLILILIKIVFISKPHTAFYLKKGQLCMS